MKSLSEGIKKGNSKIQYIEGGEYKSQFGILYYSLRGGRQTFFIMAPCAVDRYECLFL